jgi:hypothetical protein
MTDLFDLEPTYIHSDADAVYDGDLIDLQANGVRVFWNGQPVTRMSAALWDALKPYNPGGPASEQAAAMTTLLGFLLAGATDTAEEGEPQGEYYRTQRYPQLKDTLPALVRAGVARTARPVWLERNATGWTAMFPSDR